MPIYQSMLEKEVFFLSFFLSFFFHLFFIFFLTTNFFSNFKGVPVVRATYQEGAGLPNYQGKIRVKYYNWTNGLEVMTYFLT